MSYHDTSARQTRRLHAFITRPGAWRSQRITGAIGSYVIHDGDIVVRVEAGRPVEAGATSRSGGTRLRRILGRNP